jgi:hypothetical protein
MSSADGWGQLWRWPLYTPRRFFSCVAVVLGLVAISNMILGGGGGLPPPDRDVASAPSATATPTESGTSTESPTGFPTDSGFPALTTLPPITPSPSPRPPAAGGAQKASAAALAFTTAWADRTKPAAQWWAAVSRYADPEFAAQLKGTVPANVPASKVTGTPHPVSVYFASATVEVPTDAGTMVVQLVSDGHFWSVVDIHKKL